MIKSFKYIFAVLIFLVLVAIVIVPYSPKEKIYVQEKSPLERPSTQQEIRDLDFGIVRLWSDSKSSPEASTKIAKVYYEELQDYKKAMEWIEYSNKIMPTAENSDLACRILDDLDKFEESIPWCTQAYELGNENSLIGIGLAYRGAKKYKEALKWFYLANEKNIPRSANGLGMSYSALGDYVNAEKWYLQAIKDDPKNSNALNNLIYFYIVRLNDKIRGAAYAIACVNNVFPANTIAKFLIVTHKIPLEDLLKAYEFQLNNPILPYKFEEKQRLGMLNEKGYIRLKKEYLEEVKREKSKK